ncbi:MAG: hypothetical protein QNJ49_03745 [Mastigocoleus sp. MO_167.B18]|nr:hypothetical protein [Mastigocoleus sp. MO_167.B18]
MDTNKQQCKALLLEDINPQEQAIISGGDGETSYGWADAFSLEATSQTITITETVDTFKAGGFSIGGYYESYDD